MAPKPIVFRNQLAWQIAQPDGGASVVRVPDHPKSAQLGFWIDGFKSAVVKALEPLARTDIFVDVGANWGQTMLEMYALNPEIRYFGFEPNAEPFAYLQDLAKANRIHASLFPWACADQAKPLQLYRTNALDSSATTQPSIRPDTYEQADGDWIAAYTLDQSLPEEVGANFILKIDVEGGENEVLEGAARMLTRQRPWILCEVLHAHRESEFGLNNIRKKMLEKILDHFEYAIYQCLLSAQEREHLMGFQLIRQFQRSQLWAKSPNTCDYLFVPRELENEFIREVLSRI